MTEANHHQQQQQQQHQDMMIEQQEQSEVTNATVASSSSSILVWQTMIREVLLQPYLPPPVIRFIHMIDTLLYDMYGISEATVTILFTLLIAYIIRYMIQLLLLIVTKRHGRAIKDDDTDNDTMMKKEKQHADYDTTVLFTGPRNSGKTTLFYQFVYNMESSTTTGTTSNNNTSDTKHLLPTVMSLRPNIGYVVNEIVDNMNHDISDTNNNQQQLQHHQKIRCIDYPGYMNIYDPTYSKFITNNHPVSSSSSSSSTQTPPPPTRIVLVVDATQSVTSSAEILFHLFTLLYDSYYSTATMNAKSSKRLQPVLLPIQKSSIFVACHKQDHSKSKNEKRIKIQLRTELERLIYNTTVQQQQQMNKAVQQDATTNDINNKATTVTTNHEYWWNCTKSTRNSNNNSSSSSTTTSIAANNTTKSLQLQFTINVDFDELDFIEMIYFYPTSSSSTKELYEFCTTGRVQQ